MESAFEMPKFTVMWSVLPPCRDFRASGQRLGRARREYQIADYASTLDGRSAFLLFRHPDETYLVQCRASYDVTRTPSAHSNPYKLQ